MDGNRPVLVCYITWMDEYRGWSNLDRPVGGGEFVELNEFGCEAFNFVRDTDGLFRGFFQPQGKGVNAERLGAPSGAESVDGITVIWCATSPDKNETLIVGWYTNATAFAESPESPASTIRLAPDGVRHIVPFNPGDPVPFYVQSSEAVLLKPQQRNFKIPTRGSSAIRYPSSSKDWDVLVEGMMNYIRNWEKLQGKTPLSGASADDALQAASKEAVSRQAFHSGWVLDPEERKAIESVGMELTSSWYSEHQYKVEPVPTENKGWDIEATSKGGELLRIEVKATKAAPTSFCVELTPNEFEQMKRHRSSYRICVVCNALANPELIRFRWNEELESWKDEDSSLLLTIEERISARISPLNRFEDADD